MVTFLITSVLVLGLIAIAIYFWQKPANRTETIELPPPPQMSGLFAGEEEPAQLASAAKIQEPSMLEAAAEIDKRQINKQLANEFIESWQKSPDRVSTAKMLHHAALSDDAETFSKAVELAFSFWQKGRIPDLSAMELQALLNGEFWLLSASTRNSGAGFVLKRTLSRAKRELERANNTH